MTIGEKIKARREELGMRQIDLARKLGYTSPAAISLIEKGKNQLKQKKIKAIADALNVDPLWLIGITDSMEGKNVPKNAEILKDIEAFIGKSDKNREIAAMVCRVQECDLDFLWNLLSKIVGGTE